MAKNEKIRKLISTIKSLLTWWDDIPFKDMKNEIMYFKATPKMEIMFIHVREPKEIQKLKERLNATTVLVRRLGDEVNETSNHADANVFEYEYDYAIYVCMVLFYTSLWYGSLLDCRFGCKNNSADCNQ